MFVRISRPHEEQELLLNADHISKIVVSYVIGNEPNYTKTSLKDGADNPKAKRVYQVHVGSDVIRVVSKPDDPVVAFLESLYRDAMKG